jgi:hypothetical protein
VHIRRARQCQEKAQEEKEKEKETIPTLHTEVRGQGLWRRWLRRDLWCSLRWRRHLPSRDVFAILHRQERLR